MDNLLKICVHKGVVDYSYLKTKESIVDQKIKELSLMDLQKASDNEKKAFWINAYNLSTIKLILMHYPVKSIKDIPVKARWEWNGWKFNNRELSLDDIENKILRPMGDPRIHFAINCASKSCPEIANEFYDSDRINEQLDRSTVQFLRDKSRGLKIEHYKSYFGWGSEVTAVKISKLFNWFGVDFIKYKGSISGFLKGYTDKDITKQIELLQDEDFNYLDYDWTLNGR